MREVVNDVVGSGLVRGPHIWGILSGRAFTPPSIYFFIRAARNRLTPRHLSDTSIHLSHSRSHAVCGCPTPRTKGLLRRPSYHPGIGKPRAKLTTRSLSSATSVSSSSSAAKSASFGPETACQREGDQGRV